MNADRSITSALHWDPAKFRRDSAGDPFEAQIGQHRPTAKFCVSAGQTVFSRDDRRCSTPPPVFELYYDI